MLRKRPDEDLSVDEIKQLLMEKRRAQRENRLDEYRRTGRVVQLETDPVEGGAQPGTKSSEFPSRKDQSRSRRRKGIDTLLLMVEIVAVLGLIFLIFNGVKILRTLNQEAATVLQQPTYTPTALASAVVLPSGHVVPRDGNESSFNEAEIPEELRPRMESYARLPTPTQGPQQALRVQIPAINVDAPIVAGDGWEELKQGVGQHVGSGTPGEPGNLVLSAHNDIFGELFRHLDKLEEGDKIIIITQDSSFTYVVTETLIVKPTQVDVMSATSESSITLISCYPYLVDNKRIVVQGILE